MEEEKKIDSLITSNSDKVVQECESFKFYQLSKFLQRILGKSNVKRVKIFCNWTTSTNIANIWNKMSKGDYTWNNIKLVWGDDYDYSVVINCPLINDFIDTKNTIIFRMEPNMNSHEELWGEWSNPDPSDFIKVCYHDTEYNNNEWHISKTYNELVQFHPEKTTDVLSTILSGKYSDHGHVKRVDFIKFLEKKGMKVDVYGDNKWDYVDYKGSLPYHCKDAGLFSYRYTFNCENQSIPNYYTEKLIDGILSECLVFYSGCYNVKEYIDERAFVYLELSNFEKDYETIKRAIEENWWEQYLPFIKKAKIKILNELQFFPRLERIITAHEREHEHERENN